MAGRGATGPAPGSGTTYLNMPNTNLNYASTPDVAANSIASDIDLRMKLAMTSWTASDGFAAKWDSTNQAAYRFYCSAGPLAFELSADGVNGLNATSSVGTGFTAGTTHWVRATWRNSDNRVQFFTSEDGTNWTQLGTDQSINLAGIFNSNQALVLGAAISAGNSLMLAGKIYYFELRSGIDGTIVQSVDFSAVTKIGTRNPTTVTGSAGETWTCNGSAWDWGP